MQGDPGVKRLNPPRGTSWPTKRKLVAALVWEKVKRQRGDKHRRHEVGLLKVERVKRCHSSTILESHTGVPLPSTSSVLIYSQNQTEVCYKSHKDLSLWDSTFDFPGCGKANVTHILQHIGTCQKPQIHLNILLTPFITAIEFHFQQKFENVIASRMHVKNLNMKFCMKNS